MNRSPVCIGPFWTASKSEVGRRQRGQTAKAQHGVHGQKTAQKDEPGRQAQNARSGQTSGVSQSPLAPGISNQNTQKYGRAGHQPSRPVMNSEDRIARHNEPIKQWRLIEVRLAME